MSFKFTTFLPALLVVSADVPRSGIPRANPLVSIPADATNPRRVTLQSELSSLHSMVSFFAPSADSLCSSRGLAISLFIKNMRRAQLGPFFDSDPKKSVGHFSKRVPSADCSRNYSSLVRKCKETADQSAHR